MAKPRKRDYAAEYSRRQERAKALGFTGYYERRTRTAPGSPRPSTAELRKRRGHAGRASFLAYIKPGDLVMLADHISTVRITGEKIGPFVKRVIPADLRPSREFTIRNQTMRSLARLIKDELERGAVMSLAPSLDQRRLLRASDQLERIAAGADA